MLRAAAALLIALSADLRAEVPQAADVVLTYQAFLAGAPVGQATVQVVLADGRYRISGDARAAGLLEQLTRWRSHFLADGRLTVDGREPRVFFYDERDSGKHREVRVTDGTLEEKKNGELRRKGPSFPGDDLLSALFVEPRCEGDRMLHTGRSSYQLTTLADGEHSCRFAVVDDEDDRFEVDLQLARHRQLLVPERIQVRGGLTGWLQLVDTAPVDR